jgi:hypothetical protein
MEHVYMQPPEGGEPKLVPAVPDELVPLMVQGWRQVEAPAQEKDEAEE